MMEELDKPMNKFEKVILTASRARQLHDTGMNNPENMDGEKVTTYVIQEMKDGKLAFEDEDDDE